MCLWRNIYSNLLLIFNYIICLFTKSKSSCYIYVNLCKYILSICNGVEEEKGSLSLFILLFNFHVNLSACLFLSLSLFISFSLVFYSRFFFITDKFVCVCVCLLWVRWYYFSLLLLVWKYQYINFIFKRILSWNIILGRKFPPIICFILFYSDFYVWKISY